MQPHRNPGDLVVYRYGAHEVTLLERSDFISYERATHLGVGQLPKYLQKRIESGKQLFGSEELLVQAFDEMNGDLAVTTERRVQRMIQKGIYEPSDGYDQCTQGLAQDVAHAMRTADAISTNVAQAVVRKANAALQEACEDDEASRLSDEEEPSVVSGVSSVNLALVPTPRTAAVQVLDGPESTQTTQLKSGGTLSVITSLPLYMHEFRELARTEVEASLVERATPKYVVNHLDHLHHPHVYRLLHFCLKLMQVPGVMSEMTVCASGQKYVQVHDLPNTSVRLLCLYLDGSNVKVSNLVVSKGELKESLEISTPHGFCVADSIIRGQTSSYRMTHNVGIALYFRFIEGGSESTPADSIPMDQGSMSERSSIVSTVSVRDVTEHHRNSVRTSHPIESHPPRIPTLQSPRRIKQPDEALSSSSGSSSSSSNTYRGKPVVTFDRPVEPQSSVSSSSISDTSSRYPPRVNPDDLTSKNETPMTRFGKPRLGALGSYSIKQVDGSTPRGDAKPEFSPKFSYSVKDMHVDGNISSPRGDPKPAFSPKFSYSVKPVPDVKQANFGSEISQITSSITDPEPPPKRFSYSVKPTRENRSFVDAYSKRSTTTPRPAPSQWSDPACSDELSSEPGALRVLPSQDLSGFDVQSQVSSDHSSVSDPRIHRVEPFYPNADPRIYSPRHRIHPPQEPEGERIVQAPTPRVRNTAAPSYKQDEDPPIIKTSFSGTSSSQRSFVPPRSVHRGVNPRIQNTETPKISTNFAGRQSLAFEDRLDPRVSQRETSRISTASVGGRRSPSPMTISTVAKDEFVSRKSKIRYQPGLFEESSDSISVQSPRAQAAELRKARIQTSYHREAVSPLRARNQSVPQASPRHIRPSEESKTGSYLRSLPSPRKTQGESFRQASPRRHHSSEGGSYHQRVPSTMKIRHEQGQPGYNRILSSPRNARQEATQSGDYHRGRTPPRLNRAEDAEKKRKEAEKARRLEKIGFIASRLAIQRQQEAAQAPSPPSSEASLRVHGIESPRVAGSPRGTDKAGRAHWLGRKNSKQNSSPAQKLPPRKYTSGKILFEKSTPRRNESNNATPRSGSRMSSPLKTRNSVINERKSPTNNVALLSPRRKSNVTKDIPLLPTAKKPVLTRSSPTKDTLETVIQQNPALRAALARSQSSSSTATMEDIIAEIVALGFENDSWRWTPQKWAQLRKVCDQKGPLERTRHLEALLDTSRE